jgi:hypothetical protein
VDTETGPIAVEVDFLTLEPEGNMPGDYYQTIQGIEALKVRGGDLVFKGPLKEKVEGELDELAEEFQGFLDHELVREVSKGQLCPFHP